MRSLFHCLPTLDKFIDGGKLESLPSMLASSPVLSANAVEIKIPPVPQVLLLPVVLPETAYTPRPDNPTKIVSVREPLGEAGIGLVR